jgi:hypothetical protein
LRKITVAAKSIEDVLVQAYRDQRGVHAETVVGAAAALAGEFALRASGVELPKKGWIAGGIADGLLFEPGDEKSLTLWRAIREWAIRAGADEAKLPKVEAVVAEVAQRVGGAPFPPLSVSFDRYPREWSPNAAPRFRERIMAIARDHALTPVETAFALAFVVGNLIDRTKAILPPEIGATIALEIMIGVSRMAPLDTVVETSKSL